MDRQQELANVISQADGAQFFRLIQNSRSKIHEGVIKLAQFSESKTYFINIDKFSQNIVPGTPFVYIRTQAGLTLIFPHIESGLNGIFIQQSDNLLQFQNNLNQVVQMVPFDQAMQIQQFKDTIDVHCKDIASNTLENPNDVSAYIVKGGDLLKQGFQFLGTAIASGINKGGEYISSKIDPGEQVEVKPETKSKYQDVKGKVSNAFEVTGNILSQLYKPVAEKTKELTNELGQKIDSSDSTILKQTKSLTVATWDAAGSALGGLGSALGTVGDSIGTNTKNIVQKKYGDDVVKTYLQGNPDPNNQQLNEPLIQPQADQQQQQEPVVDNNPYPKFQ
ncbi:hypothetical protein pb186bvf_012894 [Paramecium bursaria]